MAGFHSTGSNNCYCLGLRDVGRGEHSQCPESWLRSRHPGPLWPRSGEADQSNAGADPQHHNSDPGQQCSVQAGQYTHLPVP